MTVRTEFAVEAQAIAKFYGPATALDGAELTVAAGTVHGLTGPSGAGKTTLLAALLGLAIPDEGTLRLFGRTHAEADARPEDLTVRSGSRHCAGTRFRFVPIERPR